jgi:hypothetical protein
MEIMLAINKQSTRIRKSIKFKIMWHCLINKVRVITQYKNKPTKIACSDYIELGQYVHIRKRFKMGNSRRWRTILYKIRFKFYRYKWLLQNESLPTNLKSYN